MSRPRRATSTKTHTGADKTRLGAPEGIDYEPALDHVIKVARDGTDGRVPNLHFSTNISKAIDEAQLIFVAVNTPTKTVGLGADIDGISRVVGQDNRIGSRMLKASAGLGGSCFKKDVLSLVYIAESPF
ncbi:related to UDP-glucose 6-dehydrogenase [Lecanosticta acicola]|uniref:Related to UDP-glucose 6-dehydrogenase n=1 Tax=Lecanosticta acicola TaxID=111012 RepID=A0AAI8YZE6_9PEZI|nr:related to UDP-glucose 6-dehydrogenase [Lecanosticta acicola]